MRLNVGILKKIILFGVVTIPFFSIVASDVSDELFFESNGEIVEMGTSSETSHAPEDVAKCEKIFQDNNCQEKIDKDELGNRKNYINCKEPQSYRRMALRCGQGAVLGTFDLATGLILAPVAPVLMAKSVIANDEKCSLDTKQKETLLFAIQPLLSPVVYNKYLTVMGCNQLRQFVQVRLQSEMSAIAQKRSLQKKYEDYLLKVYDETHRQQAERLYPSQRREISDEQKEFLRRYEEQTQGQSELQRQWTQLANDYKCYSSSYLIEKACHATTLMAGGVLAGKTASLLRGPKANGLARDALQFLRRESTDVVQNFKTSSTKNVSRMGGGSTEKYFVELKNKQSGIFKPCRDQQLAANCNSEVAAYEFDQLVGFNLVPETVMRDVRLGLKSEKGSMQLYVNAPVADKVSPFKMNAIDLHKQDLLDYLIQNSDRHGYNYLVQKNGSVVSIDHGVAFRGNYTGKPDYKSLLKSKEGKIIIENLRHVQLGDIDSKLGQYLNVDQRRLLYQRIQEALKDIESLEKK